MEQKIDTRWICIWGWKWIISTEMDMR